MNILNRLKICAVLLVLALSPGLSQAGGPAPDFTLTGIDGQKLTLSSFRGKVPVLLAFGATWCPYCTRQVPKLIQLRKTLGPDEVMLIGIDSREPRDRVAAHAEKYGVNYPVALDSDGRVVERYGVEGIPYLVLIDKEGSIVSAGHGVTDGLIKLIQSLD